MEEGAETRDGKDGKGVRRAVGVANEGRTAMLRIGTKG